jgi:hypothetical protein
MTKKRSSDNTPRTDQTHRANRGYEINGQWYFELRGGGQKGPFETKEEMQAELNEFINLHEEMNQQV